MERQTYEMQIAGLTRKLPLFAVSDDLTIAAFILFGDVELTEHAAKALLKQLPITTSSSPPRPRASRWSTRWPSRPDRTTTSSPARL